MRVAIIPARGGSKRIPRKNIKDFFGKPMLVWTIEAAKKSKVFDRIIVSTDDDEISAIALSHGAEVPFKRPAELSDDHTATTAVIAQAIKFLSSEGECPESVCCLYATAPFIQHQDIINSLKIFEQGGWHYCFTAAEFSAPIFRSFKMNKNGGAEMLYPEYFQTRSQDLPVAFHDAGQFYWGTAKAWVNNEIVFSDKSYVYKIPSWRVQDIDTRDDWERAELLAPQLLQKEK